MKQDPDQAAISPKLKALLNIAEKVRLGGRSVQPQDVDRARQEGATDQEIHDTVLIAAAFCMYNRYVDGLATWAPEAAEPYKGQAVELARHGYLNPIDKAFAAASDAWLSVQKPTS